MRCWPTGNAVRWSVPRGDIVWMCAPRWDSGALFSALLGGRSGYSVTPIGRFVWGGFYEEASLIWRSRWITEHGVLECREALAFPGDTHRAVLLRRIIAADGDAAVRVTLNASAEFDQEPLREHTGTRSGLDSHDRKTPPAVDRRRDLPTELRPTAGPVPVRSPCAPAGITT